MKAAIQFVKLPVATADGNFIARYSEKGLAELDFPNSNRWRRDDEHLTQDSFRNSTPRLRRAKVSGWHRLTEAALKKVLAGRAFQKLPPLDWTGKSEFKKSVWRALLKITIGKTKSYGEIARAIGRPKGARAVGGACGANPIPVLVPCHRVLAANQKLGGFSGGLERKRSLLKREGIKI